MQDKIKGITNKQFLAMAVIMVIIAAISLTLSHCNCKRNHAQSKIDSVDFKLMKSFIEKKLIKDKIKKYDSIDRVLVKLDTIYVDRWHKAKEVAMQAPDTCQQYIRRLINVCDSMARHKDSIINNLRIRIENQNVLSAKDSSDIGLLYKEKAKADSTIFSLQNQLEKAIKQKKNWRTGFIIQGGYIILREGKSALLN